MVRTRSRRGGVVLFAALGLVGVAGAAALAFSDYQEYQDAPAADGIVTHLNAGGSHPEIEFTTPDGQTVSYPQGGMIWGYAPGDHVRVLYLRDDPRLDPTLDAIGARYDGPCIVGFMASIALAFATLGLIGTRRARGSKELVRMLRWQEHGLRARARPRWIRIVPCYIAGAMIAVSAVASGAQLVAISSGILCVGWGGYLTFLRATSISFERGRLVVDSGLFSRRFEADLAHIARFEVREAKDGSDEIIAVQTSGIRGVLPIEIHGLRLVSRPGNRQVFPSPVQHAEFVVARLTHMLASARSISA